LLRELLPLLVLVLELPHLRVELAAMVYQQRQQAVQAEEEQLIVTVLVVQEGQLQHQTITQALAAVVLVEELKAVYQHHQEI
jgi:hypothetical protein